MNKGRSRTEIQFQPKRYRHRPTLVGAIRYDGTRACADAIINWSQGKFLLDDYDRLCALTPDGLRYVSEGYLAVLGVVGEPYMVSPEVEAISYGEVADGYTAPLDIYRVRQLVAEARTAPTRDRLRDIIALLGAHCEALQA